MPVIPAIWQPPSPRPPFENQILERKTLKTQFPNVHWDAQSSGTQIPDAVAKDLEEIWKDFSVQRNSTIRNLKRKGVRFGTPEHNKKVEQIAVDIVTDWHRRRRWTVTDVSNEKRGYDLICERKKKKIYIEVKGSSADSVSFILTTNELGQARSNKDFYFGIVTKALSDNCELQIFTGKQFFKDFAIRPTQYIATSK